MGLERVGIHDNFFELGGHSLLATRVIARANSVLDVDLAVRRLFETPTIAALAAEVQLQRAAGQRPRGDSPRGSPGRRPCDPALLRPAATLVPGTLEGELGAYNIPFAVRLRGRLDAESLRQGVGDYPSSDTNRCERPFGCRTGNRCKSFRAPSRFDLPLVDLGDLPPEQREAALCVRRRDEALRPFDLNADSMLRASLVRLADEEHVLLLTLHHIATDGWSIRLLWRELEVAYAAYRKDE